jgi:hypothetical protein
LEATMLRWALGGAAVLVTITGGCDGPGAAGGVVVEPSAHALRMKEIVGPCDIAGQEVSTLAAGGDIAAVRNAGRTAAVSCTAAVEQLTALNPQGADAAATARMLSARDVCRSAYQTRVRALELVGQVDEAGNTPSGTEQAGAQWQAGLQACQTAMNGLTGQTAAASAPATPATPPAMSDADVRQVLLTAGSSCDQAYDRVTAAAGEDGPRIAAAQAGLPTCDAGLRQMSEAAAATPAGREALQTCVAAYRIRTDTLRFLTTAQDADPQALPRFNAYAQQWNTAVAPCLQNLNTLGGGAAQAQAPSAAAGDVAFPAASKGAEMSQELSKAR